MTNITDYNHYNSGMKKSIKDKLFFEGLVDDNVDTFVDFGCADGQILKQVGVDFPDWNLIGVDNDSNMIEEAQINSPHCTKFFNSLSDIKITDSTILNLSSVIHEVYSYCRPEEIFDFWESVFKKGFKYISIRDLIVNSSTNRPSDINDVIKINGLEPDNQKRLDEFIDIWGNLYTQKNLIHYLLKYRYIENWDREVRENYLPLTLEGLLNKIPYTYEVVYFTHYILPFTKDIINRDFGIELKDNTHIKMLLKRKDI